MRGDFLSPYTPVLWALFWTVLWRISRLVVQVPVNFYCTNLIKWLIANPILQLIKTCG